MNNKYMLDTDICSYIIKENSELAVQKFWEHKNDELCISVISYAELMYGSLHRGSLSMNSKIKRFLESFSIINFDESAAKHYAQIRQTLVSEGIPIEDMDMLIAACAISENAVLVTNNEKHFSRIENLKIENWS